MVQTRHEYWSPIRNYIDKYNYSKFPYFAMGTVDITYITGMYNRVIEIKHVFMITLQHFKQIKSVK